MLPFPPERDLDLAEFRRLHPIGARQRAVMNEEREQAEKNLKRLRDENALLMRCFQDRLNRLKHIVHTALATLT